VENQEIWLVSRSSILFSYSSFCNRHSKKAGHTGDFGLTCNGKELTATRFLPFKSSQGESSEPSMTIYFRCFPEMSGTFDFVFFAPNSARHITSVRLTWA
jgi:hypothetical protein